MSVKQYIGARYVPLLDGDWDANKAYEPLTTVNYGNATYTSKKSVPVGTLPTDSDYWMQTGFGNQQVTSILDWKNNTVDPFISDTQTDISGLKSAVSNINTNISDLQDEINNIQVNFDYATPEEFGALGDGSTDDTQAIQDAVNSGKPVLALQNYKITSPITLSGDSQTFIATGEIVATGGGFVLTGCFTTLRINKLTGSGTGTAIHMLKDSDNNNISRFKGLLAHCKIEAIDIERFSRGVYFEVSGNAKGIQYNVFKAGLVNTADTGIEYNVTGTNCWCCQNAFYDARISANIPIKLISTSNISDGNLFENVGIECYQTNSINIQCQKIVSSRFNVRMLENVNTGNSIDLTDCYDLHFMGSILLELDRIRDTNTNPLTTLTGMVFANFYDCYRIDSTRGGGWRGKKMISGYGCYMLIDPTISAQIEALSTYVTFGADINLAPSNVSYFRLDASTAEAGIIFPATLYGYLTELFVNIGNNTNGIKLCLGTQSNVVYDLSNLEAGTYLLKRYGTSFRALKI